VVNGISYLFPRWVGVVEGAALLVLLGGTAGWLTLEYRWSDRTVSLQSPLRVERDE
jgi:hypothetical protein